MSVLTQHLYFGFALVRNDHHLRHFTPYSSVDMSMEESISLEETNKIRISLGLKPLADDSKPTDDKEQEAQDNYAKQREKELKEREAKYVHRMRKPVSCSLSHRKIQDNIAK